MDKVTKQMEMWGREFGKEYTDRNVISLDEMESLYQKSYGITRTKLNESFLAGINRSIRILEVGSNVGNQLLCLQKMGFENLYGIELQNYAVELSKTRTKNINIIHGSAFDIPFKDNYFNLIFTSGLLIHIHPSDILEVLKEIYRCTKEYIWGFEYYADQLTEVVYREHKDLLWKTDYARLYIESLDSLELVKEERLKYLENNNTENSNIDSMFLLKKKIWV